MSTPVVVSGSPPVEFTEFSNASLAALCDDLDADVRREKCEDK